MSSDDTAFLHCERRGRLIHVEFAARREPHAAGAFEERAFDIDARGGIRAVNEARALMRLLSGAKGRIGFANTPPAFAVLDEARALSGEPDPLCMMIKAVSISTLAAASAPWRAKELRGADLPALAQFAGVDIGEAKRTWKTAPLAAALALASEAIGRMVARRAKFVSAYSAGLLEIAKRSGWRFSIQGEEMLAEEVADADGLLPVFACMADIERAGSIGGSAMLELARSGKLLTECEIVDAPEGLPLSPLLQSTAKRFAAFVPDLFGIVSLDPLYKEWRASLIKEYAHCFPKTL